MNITIPRSMIVAAVLLVTIVPAIADADLSSPRATFETFLSSMIRAKSGEAAALDDAVATLDLGAVAPAARASAGPRLAGQLKTYLDKVQFVDVSEIPSEVDGDVWVYLKTPEGTVSLRRGEDGDWRFSEHTLESLPALLESVRDRDYVAGIEGGGGFRPTWDDWIRARVPESLQGRIFLLEGWQWLGLLVLALLGVIVDRVVRYLVRHWIVRLVRSRAIRAEITELDFGKPVGILAMALTWSLLLWLLGLPLGVLNALVVATRILMAAAGVWATYRLVDVAAVYFGSLAEKTETHLDDLLVPLIRRSLKMLVVAVGVIFVAQNLDVNVSSLLAGLGIGGLAFALAARDTVENLFGSVTVLIDHPFKIGDWVKIGNLEGTVEELGLRSTRIRTFYNSLITVPNSHLVKTAVDNLGERKYRRLSCKLGVQYDTSPDKIEAFCEGVRELIRRHPYTRKDYYMVYFNEFADFSLNVLLYVFWETPDWATELRERHRLLVDIVRLAKRLGVEFAFPTSTLHVSSMPSGTASPAEGLLQGEVTGDPVFLGRAEADAIVRRSGEGHREPPVDFAVPDTVRIGGSTDDG